MTTPAPETASVDPIDKAVELIRAHWDVGMAVILTRDHDPAAVPEYGETATIDGICRRIVAALLNDGWTAATREDTP